MKQHGSKWMLLIFDIWTFLKICPEHWLNSDTNKGQFTSAGLFKQCCLESRPNLKGKLSEYSITMHAPYSQKCHCICQITDVRVTELWEFSVRELLLRAFKNFTPRVRKLRFPCLERYLTNALQSKILSSLNNSHNFLITFKRTYLQNLPATWNLHSEFTPRTSTSATFTTGYYMACTERTSACNHNRERLISSRHPRQCPVLYNTTSRGVTACHGGI
jgi:hypothetical protein